MSGPRTAELVGLAEDRRLEELQRIFYRNTATDDRRAVIDAVRSYPWYAAGPGARGLNTCRKMSDALIGGFEPRTRATWSTIRAAAGGGRRILVADLSRRHGVPARSAGTGPAIRRSVRVTQRRGDWRVLPSTPTIASPCPATRGTPFAPGSKEVRPSTGTCSPMR